MIKLNELPLDKATENDKRSLLRAALTSLEADGLYFWLADYDDTYIYFEAYGCNKGSAYFRVDYTLSGNVATLGEDVAKVTCMSDWQVVSEDAEEEVVTKSWLESCLTKYFGQVDGSKAIIKQFNDEEMVAIEPLYVSANTVDAHGDALASEDVTRGMVDSLNKAIEEGNLQSGLFHKHKTDGFTIEKAWVNEAECVIGETLVEEGLPLVKVKFHSDTLWEQRKTGGLMGLSIGAKGSVEVIDE